ncbi:MAG: monovalent cation/H(+) antiporter subunit G [Pseudomonadota bacterium]
MSDLIIWALILFGSAFTVFAGIGIVRLPDVYIRMHAATKVGTLGSGLIMAGVAVYFGDPAVVLRCILIAVFLMVTAPIGAHMIGRAALETGVPVWGVKPKADDAPTTTADQTE